MNEIGSYIVHFSDKFERDALKLIEISPEIAEELSLGGQPLTIRGAVTDNVVAVNRNQTFKVNLLETSNTLLLVRPLETNEGIKEVISALDHHYELVEIVPDFSSLVNLLKQHSLSNDNLDMFHSNPGTFNPPGITMTEIQNIVQASDEQIMTELHERRAIEIQGCWFSLDMMLINTVLREIIDVVQACSLSMSRLPFMEIATELADAYPSLLIKHILNCFKEKDGFEEADGIYRLDEKSICRQLAIRIFLEHPRIPYDEFMEKWTVELPGLLQANDSYLKGIAYVEEKSFQKYLCYLPIERLPLDPKKRFDFLFGIRAKWPVDEMTAFIEDIVVRGHQLEDIILKYTKTIQKGQLFIAKSVPR